MDFLIYLCGDCGIDMALCYWHGIYCGPGARGFLYLTRSLRIHDLSYHV